MVNIIIVTYDVGVHFVVIVHVVITIGIVFVLCPCCSCSIIVVLKFIEILLSSPCFLIIRSNYIFIYIFQYFYLPIYLDLSIFLFI